MNTRDQLAGLAAASKRQGRDARAQFPGSEDKDHLFEAVVTGAAEGRGVKYYSVALLLVDGTNSTAYTRVLTHPGNSSFVTGDRVRVQFRGGGETPIIVAGSGSGTSTSGSEVLISFSAGYLSEH